jgi:hypothetical protein
MDPVVGVSFMLSFMTFAVLWQTPVLELETAGDEAQALLAQMQRLIPIGSLQSRDRHPGVGLASFAFYFSTASSGDRLPFGH